MRKLLESGVHYGHQTKRWNPKMKPYIYGARNDIHIIDLGNSTDCKSTKVGIEKKWLGIRVADDTYTGVTIKFIKLFLELGAEIRIFQMMDTAFETFLF